MKNILFVESGSGFGGSSVCLYNILRCLDKSKFYPLVLYYNYGPNIEKIKSCGVKTIQSRGALLCIILPILLLRYRFFAIHTNNDLYSQIPAIFFAKLFKIPCVCHMRRIKKLTKRERIFSKYVELFICVSHVAKGALVRQGIDAKRIAVVYDGIDLGRFKGVGGDGELKKELRIGQNTKLVGLISRFTKGKGIEYFIQAAKIVSRNHTNVKFVIAGDVTDSSKKYLLDSFKLLVKDLHLENNLFFLGWRKDIGTIYHSLDIAVSTSLLEESFGMVNIEAMAASKPIVASDVGAYKEIVIDGVNGFLVQPKDVQALAQRIMVLLSDERLSKKMGDEGSKRVEKIFDIKENVKKLEGIYSKLI